MCQPAGATGASAPASVHTASAGASGFPAPPGSMWLLARAATGCPRWVLQAARTGEAVPAGACGFLRPPGSTPPAAPAAFEYTPLLHCPCKARGACEALTCFNDVQSQMGQELTSTGAPLQHGAHHEDVWLYAHASMLQTQWVPKTRQLLRVRAAT